MDVAFSRRTLFEGLAAVGGSLALAESSTAGPISAISAKHHPEWVFGRMTGAEAITRALLLEGTGCVYGIPGAQENELWDTFKKLGLPYLLVTHEFSAAAMADGYARSIGRPGVMSVVPGPGVTNSLTALGEALLDSSPIVAIVGDIANGEHFRPFQVHALPNVDLLKPVCKCVYAVQTVDQIPGAVRQAFATAMAGEPGPVAVVVPYNLLIETADFRSPPPSALALPFDEAGFQAALALLCERNSRIGIYAGAGCLDYSDRLAAVAELLQSPVATSVSGKGALGDRHTLAVGWGFGPHASRLAEVVFAGEKLHPHKTGVTTILAIGVKFSEVSTGFYGNPQPKRLIHVDTCASNLGRIMPTDVCVHADAGLFLDRLLTHAEQLRRPADARLTTEICSLKNAIEREIRSVAPGKCGVDPLTLIGALRRNLNEDALLFTDVSVSEHLAAEYYQTWKARTYFNPVDNQAMGWSIPAAIGAQFAQRNKTVATITGDGCLLMSAMEISTAARESLPVKFFILDDQAYHYMQMLQKAAYVRTTATHLAKIDYRALAQAFGVAYQEINSANELENAIQGIIAYPGPVLVRVSTDYGNRKIRWIEAVRKRYTKELSPAQKAKFLARIGARSICGEDRND